MAFPVSDRLRDRVWDKRLDVFVEHRFLDLVLNLRTRRESKTHLGKTIATGLSCPVYVLAMLGTSFVTSKRLDVVHC